MFVSDRPIRRERLGYMQVIDVVDRHFRRHVGGDGTKRIRGGVNHHLTVEGSIEGVSCPETNGVFTDEIIVVIEVAARSDRGQKGMTHEGYRAGVEIEVAFIA